MRTLLLTAALSLTLPAGAEEVRLQDNAPEQHVVHLATKYAMDGHHIRELDRAG